MFGLSIAVGPLNKYLDKLRAGAIAPLLSGGIRFPYYYPGNTVDALSAFFSDRSSRYLRASHEQYFIAVDFPLLKVDPSKIVPGR